MLRSNFFKAPDLTQPISGAELGSAVREARARRTALISQASTIPSSNNRSANASLTASLTSTTTSTDAIKNEPKETLSNEDIEILKEIEMANIKITNAPSQSVFFEIFEDIQRLVQSYATNSLIKNNLEILLHNTAAKVGTFIIENPRTGVAFVNSLNEMTDHLGIDRIVLSVVHEMDTSNDEQLAQIVYAEHQAQLFAADEVLARTLAGERPGTAYSGQEDEELNLAIALSLRGF